jgi:uncharacterized iron-regulated membrane protein
LAILTRLTNTLGLLLLAPVLLLWSIGLSLFVIVGSTAQGIRKVWR